MDVDEVILEAYGLLMKNSYYTLMNVGSHRAELCVYDAKRALKSVHDRSYKESFWESADWDELAKKLVAYTNSRLAPSGRSYQKLVKERLELMPRAVT